MGSIRIGVVAFGFFLSQFSVAQDQRARGLFLFPLPPFSMQQDFRHKQSPKKQKLLKKSNHAFMGNPLSWFLPNAYAGRIGRSVAQDARDEARQDTQQATWQNFDATLMQWMNQKHIRRHPQLQQELKELESIITSPITNYRQREVQVVSQYVSILKKVQGPYAEITQSTSKYLKQLQKGNNATVAKGYGALVTSYIKAAATEKHLHSSLRELDDVPDRCVQLASRIAQGEKKAKYADDQDEDQTSDTDEEADETEELLDDLDTVYNRYLSSYASVLGTEPEDTFEKDAESTFEEDEVTSLDSDSRHFSRMNSGDCDNLSDQELLDEVFDEEQDVAHEVSSLLSPSTPLCPTQFPDSSRGAYHSPLSFNPNTKRSRCSSYTKRRNSQESRYPQAQHRDVHRQNPFLSDSASESRWGVGGPSDEVSEYHFNHRMSDSSPRSSVLMPSQSYRNSLNPQGRQDWVDFNTNAEFSYHLRDDVSRRSSFDYSFRESLHAPSQSTLRSHPMRHDSGSHMRSSVDHLYDKRQPKTEFNSSAISLWKEPQMRFIYGQNDKDRKMYQKVLKKFQGDQQLQKALLETGNQYLEEWIEDPDDRVVRESDEYWGKNKKTNLGKNHFGIILMLVRAKLSGQVDDQSVEKILNDLSTE